MKLAVISGGTATNSLVSLYQQVSENITYILPISDNGGSTSELIRVVGGPAIGDIRSRISRLIPDDQAPLRDLFSHRLPDDASAREEWSKIVDGTHPLWDGIKSHIKELVRPFFINVNGELLKRSRPGREFQYKKASIGNLFLTGARIFCGSLDSAIELILRISMIPNTVSVLPALNTNFSHHISAQLQNGTVITGQSQISHPSQPSTDAAMDTLTRAATPLLSDSEDAHLPFTHPDLKSSQLHFSKAENVPLPSPIKRIFYINPYGEEIKPRASSRVIQSIAEADAVIFSIGSLYTSTIPVVQLQGVPDAIVSCKKRVLILNGEVDRETYGMDATGYIRAIAEACDASLLSIITHMIYLTDGGVKVDKHLLSRHGVVCVGIPGSEKKYDEKLLLKALWHTLTYEDMMKRLEEEQEKQKELARSSDVPMQED